MQFTSLSYPITAPSAWPSSFEVNLKVYLPQNSEYSSDAVLYYYYDAVRFLQTNFSVKCKKASKIATLINKNRTKRADYPGKLARTNGNSILYLPFWIKHMRGSHSAELRILVLSPEGYLLQSDKFKFRSASILDFKFEFQKKGLKLPASRQPGCLFLCRPLDRIFPRRSAGFKEFLHRRLLHDFWFYFEWSGGSNWIDRQYIRSKIGAYPNHIQSQPYSIPISLHHIAEHYVYIYIFPLYRPPSRSKMPLILSRAISLNPASTKIFFNSLIIAARLNPAHHKAFQWFRNMAEH